MALERAVPFDASGMRSVVGDAGMVAVLLDCDWDGAI